MQICVVNVATIEDDDRGKMGNTVTYLGTVSHHDHIYVYCSFDPCLIHPTPSQYSVTSRCFVYNLYDGPGVGASNKP
jgi:hypothetical protein